MGYVLGEIMAAHTYSIFVKYNLLVSIRTIGHGHLQYARDIARHIDTKIEAVLKKK